MVEEQPDWRTGKICYIEIPAADVARSAEFYQQAFGWKIRSRGDGATSFDDTVGQVSGSFVVGRPPASDPGFRIYIMVANAGPPWRRCRPRAAKSSGRWTRPRAKYSPGSRIPPATPSASTSSLA